MVDTSLFLTVGVSVLVVALLAMMLKLMLLALVIDDWLDLRHMSTSSPTRLVGLDELGNASLRCLSMILNVGVGATWVIVALNVDTPTIRVTALAFIIAVTTIGQVLIALVQGGRSLLFRRRMAQMLSGHRRPSAKAISDAC